MKEFYNFFRQWYNPAKHAGMFPEKLEMMAVTGLERTVTSLHVRSRKTQAQVLGIK